MMPKVKAPIHRYEIEAIYYHNSVIQSKLLEILSLKHFSTTNKTSYGNLEQNPVPTFFNKLKSRSEKERYDYFFPKLPKLGKLELF